MRTVTLAAPLLLLFAGTLAVAQTPPLTPQTNMAPTDPIAGFVTDAARRFGVPADWIRAVMRAESAGDVRAVSPKGAMGLMQIMPDTWGELRVRYRLGADPYDPRDNILAGAAYLREMYDRFGSPGFLAAYNAGPGRYEEYVSHGRPLPAETRAYVAVLAPIIGASTDAPMLVAAVDPHAWTRAPLFVSRHREDDDAARAAAVAPSVERSAVDLSATAPQSDGLFVQRSPEARLQ